MPSEANKEHPLAEVFGFPTGNFSDKAKRHRRNRLCPFHNRVPNCTKDKANDPLGVCSIFHDGNIVVTCPIRFREKWLVTTGACDFFFPKDTRWTSLAEVRLNDKDGKTAGHIDIVLVAYDDRGRVTDFGALEVQAVYISGNIRRPFEHYMERPGKRIDMVWRGKPHYPKPDYLSSSRKRLVPQILYKGGILKTWGKKQAIAIQKSFYDTLPKMPSVAPGKADLAWMIYDLQSGGHSDSYHLIQKDIIYTEFRPALKRIITPEPGKIGEFMDLLQDKLDERLEGNPPDAPTLADTLLH